MDFGLAGQNVAFSLILLRKRVLHGHARIPRGDANGMTATENKKLIQEGFESRAQGGGFFHLLADDVRWIISGS